jgi:short-subunit dehydrogenase
MKNILITGASSGIGAELAKSYSKEKVRLLLLARSEERLQKIANICIKNGSEVKIVICDICSADIKVQIEKICASYKIDLLILSAGVSDGILNNLKEFDKIQKIFDTNLIATINIMMPILYQMIENKNGTIGIISSLASMFPLSCAASYSSSKAAIKIFGESLRCYAKNYNVTISVIVPGFIDTPMTKKNNFYMPCKMSVEKATSIIISGLEKGQGLIVFPKIIYFILKLTNFLPYKIIDFINSKLLGKTLI